MTETNEQKRTIQRMASTIQFPHTDLSDAISVAEGLLKSGGVPLSRDQLAAALGLSPSGGGFAKKVATARQFCVVDSATGKYQLTDLGFEIVDPARQQAAKAEAFLCVELYKRLYEEFRGKLLPPRPHGLENTLVNFGVSPKSATSARLAFEKSARLAGFFPNAAEDRLVMPIAASVAPDGAPHGSDKAEAQPVTSQPTVDKPTVQQTPPKELRYQLIDLLEEEGITDIESAAIWTLVQFLSGKKPSPTPTPTPTSE
jgi:hypothetical protein